MSLSEHTDKFVVYGATEHHNFHAGIVDAINDVTGMGLRFAHISYKLWPDGESGSFLDDPDEVRDKHVLIFSTPITDKLELQLRDVACACKWQYGAETVSVIMTFMRYRRQDRPEKQRKITRLRWFLHSLKSWGVDHLIVCEPHNVKNTQQYCNEVKLNLHICHPTQMFADRLERTIKTLRAGGKQVKIYAPDFGSVGRVIAFARLINASIVATPKERLNGDTVSVGGDFDPAAYLAKIHAEYGSDVDITCDPGDLADTHVIMLDDELSTGATGGDTAGLARKAGAESIRFVATHPVCSPGWKDVLKIYELPAKRPFDQVFLCNTRPRGFNQTTYEQSTGGRVEKIDLAPVFADETTKLIHELLT